MSPNSAFERLKLAVPEFAILLEVTDNSVAAAFKPVNDV
jgi:hypothetical protein